MADIVYDYSDAPTVKRFSEARAPIRGLMGPFGSGKSSGCVMELIKWGARQPLVNGKRRSRFAVIRNTYQQLRDTTIKTFLDWVPTGSFGTYQKSYHEYVINKLDDEIEIEILFRALDRPEQVSNLLSLELTGAWVNEAREIPWAVIKALQGRVARFPSVKDGGCVDPGIIMDTNPPDDESWWYDLFEVQRLPGALLFKQPGGMTPQAENKRWLAPNYYENMAVGADTEFVKVYINGEYGFVRDGKPIFPEYTDSLHCVPLAPVRKVVIKRGWDFGLTPACVLTQVTPDGRWLILDELVADDLGIETFSETVLRHCEMNYAGYEFEDYGDPAGDSKSQTDEKTCFQILRGKGVKIQPGEQTLTLRLECVRKPLTTLTGGKPQLQLDPRCKVLRKGFQGRYQYKQIKVSGAGARYHDTPDKNEYSHPHDALQYIATKVFGGAVKSKLKKEQPLRIDTRGIV